MSATQTTNLNIRIDKDVKHQAEELLHDMGLNLSTAVNIFIRQLIKDGGIPFTINAQNDNPNNYNLSLIRQKLAEAETAANDPNIQYLSAEEAMKPYREKYNYDV